MKRNISALCLALLMFLLLTANAQAANTASGQANSNQISVSLSELTPGYYLCAVWDGDELLTLFDYTVGNDGKMTAAVEVGRTLSSSDNLTLGISGANTNSEAITIHVPISSAGNNPNPGNQGGSYSSDSGGSGPTYKIILPDNLTGGRLSAQPAHAAAGSTVSITAAPNQGYYLHNMKITDANGQLIKINNIRGQRYMFTMPASQVNVQAVFQKPTEYTGTFYSLPFYDVKIGEWYYEAIRYVFERALMNGEEQTMFNPNGSLNRAMLVVILHRLENEPLLYTPDGFSDIAANRWYTNAVIWAKAGGIVNGYEDGSFAPLQNITREEMAAILYRYTQYKGQNLSVQDSLSNFRDSSQISDWATEAMQWAVGEGIINGNGDGTLAPAANTTRAETAAMIMRFLNLQTKANFLP